MHPESIPHLVIPFAACNADAWLPTLQSLPPDSFKRLSRLLQGMKLVQTDTRDAESLSPPHERALAHALGLTTPDTPDGLIPWAAREAMEGLQAAPGKAWAWITPCHWAMGHLHATMSDPALLDVREDESHRLLTLMQPYFETDGITLHYQAPGRWLAEGEPFRSLPTASIDRVLARNVDAWLPDTKSAAPLRRLQNEMQMLLYTHPFNDEREVRRQLPVNSFWISGTGSLPARSGEDLTPSLSKRAREPDSPPGNEQVSVPRSLAEAVFREDWAGYAQAWALLDSGDIAELLARQQLGETVRLSLCGDSSAQTFETHRAGLLSKISSLLKPVRPLDILRQL